MKALTIICIVLAALCFCAIGFLLYLLFAHSRLNRKLAPLSGAPKAQAEVLQQALDKTRIRPLRNAMMLGLCAKFVEAGEEKRAVELFPFVRPGSLFLDTQLYADLYEILHRDENEKDEDQK